MRHRLTYLATVALLLVGALWARPAAAQDWPHWLFDSPNSALNFRENFLFPPPDLFWFSADFGTGSGSLAGTFDTPAGSPVVLDLANDPQNPGASDPMVFVGRKDRLYAYRPDLLGSFASGAIQPANGWPITLPGAIQAPPVAATVTQNTRTGVVTRRVLYVATQGTTAADFLRITAYTLDAKNPQSNGPVKAWSRSITGILGGFTKLGGMALADIGSDGTDSHGGQNDRSTFLKRWTWNTDTEGWQGSIDGNGGISQRTTDQDSPLEPGGRGSWLLGSTAANATRNLSTEVRFVPDQLGVSGAVLSVDFQFDKRIIPDVQNIRPGSFFRWEISTNDGQSYSELYRETISTFADNQWVSRIVPQFNFGTPQDQKTNWRLRLTATLVTGTDQNTSVNVAFDFPRLTFNMLGSASAQQTLPLLFVTTQDGQVKAVNAFFDDVPGDRGGIRTVKGSDRWTWRPGAGSVPRILAGPAVGRVPLDGFNSTLNVNNSNVAAQIVARNREWLVVAGDEQGNVTALEAFGQTDTSGVLTGNGKVRWRLQLPTASTGERDAVTTPPLLWNGATGLMDRDGRFLTRLSGLDDVVMVGTRSGRVFGLDAQGDYVMTGAEANRPAGSQIGDPLGTTQQRWRYPDLGNAQSASTDAAPWDTGGDPINAPLAVWNGIGQTGDNPDNNTINLAHEDDLVYARYDQSLGPVPGEPNGPGRFREFIGAIRVYGRIETESPIDTGKSVAVFGADGARVPNAFIEVTGSFLDTSADNPDTNHDGIPDNSPPRGRITLVKQRWQDDQGVTHSINLGDQIRVVYTPSGSTSTKEEHLPFPCRRQLAKDRTGLDPTKAGAPIHASEGFLANSLQDAGTNANGLGGEELRIDQRQVDKFLHEDQAPAMAVANNTIWVGSRYRGRFYQVDAQFLRVTGFQRSTNDNPDQNTNKEDDQPGNARPVGAPGIAFGWLYVAYDSGLLAAYSNEGGGAPGSGTSPVAPGTGPGIVSGTPRNNSIEKPQIRVTDANGNPLTDEDHLLFDWGETIFIKVSAIAGGGDGFFGALTRSPIRATLRGPMGDLPPVTVTPVRIAADNPERQALLEIVVPNATSSNPMTPGTKLLKDTPLTDRFKEPHWELRVEQIGVGWRGGTATNGQPVPEGPWEPASKDQEPGSWSPDSNTAPWVSLNNPIALVYNPFDPDLTTPDTDANVAFVTRFSSDPGFQRRAERFNGDPYKQPTAGEYNQPTVLTVGTDPANGRQLLIGDHGKSTPGIVIGLTDRSDLGVTGGRGPLRVRVQGAKLTKLGSAALLNGGNAGSINQNAAYSDDGPDGYYPSITGDRLKVIKRGDGSNATISSVNLLGALTQRDGPDAKPVLGADGKPVKRLQVDPFMVSVDIPRYQPDDIYATRARVPNPTSGLFTPDTAINPLNTPYLDYVGPGTAPPNISQLQRDDAPARVTVFVDANNNGRLDLQGNYREAYRTFAVQMVVRPDFRLEVRDRTVDLGRVWHGFETPPFGQLSALPAAGQAFYRSYWKPFTLVNTGNVNLPKIKPEVVTSFQGQSTGLVALPSDGVDPFRALTLVRDPSEPNGNLVDPTNIFLRTSLDDLLKPNDGTVYDRGPGAWLQKSRVGSASPSAAIYGGDPSLDAAVAGVPANPRETFLTLNIPTGTPLGSYVGQVRFFNDQLVQAIPSTNNALGFEYGIVGTPDNGLLDRVGNTSAGFRTEPFTDPTFDLRVRVTENLALGSVLDPNNGAGTAGSRTASRTSPAAGLDQVNDRISLFYASNLPGMQAGRPLQFDLFGTNLPFDKNHNLFPFDPLPMNPAPWDKAFLISPPYNGPATATPKSTKPGYAQDTDGRGFVFWSEQASVAPGRTETRLMYRQVTPSTGDPQPLAPGGGLDTLTPRSGPAPVVVPTTGGAGTGGTNGVSGLAAQNNSTNVWYLFWHGGSAQKQSLFFSRSLTPEENRSWSAESLLPTSASLASVSDPSPSYEPGTKTLWVVYTGLSQRLGKSDAYVTKYNPRAFGDRRQFYGLLGFAPLTSDVLRPNGTRTLYAANGIDWTVDARNPVQVYLDGAPLLRQGDAGRANANGELLFQVDATQWPQLAQQGVQVVVDRAAGIVRFSMDTRRMRPLMNLPPPVALPNAIPPDPEISADYTPGTLRLTRSEQGASSTVGFVTHSFEPSWYRGLFDSARRPVQGQADRLWVIWRRAAGAVSAGPSLYYKAFRPAVHVRRGSLRDLTGLKVVSRPDLVQGATGSSTPIPIQDVDLEGGLIFFRDMDEGLSRLHGVPTPVQVTYRDPRTNSEVNEIQFINWHEETGETPVPMDIAVNEGTVTAFPVSDQVKLVDPASGNVATYPHLQKIWLFWASTRGSGSDIYQATIAPRFGPETAPLGPVSASITSRGPRVTGTLPARSLHR